MLVMISGVRQIITPQSLQIGAAIGQRTTLDFTVQDYTGTSRFLQGMPIAVYDDNGGPNLLTANQSSVETDAAGFVAVNGATIARSTAQQWQGAASLLTTTPGSVNGEGFWAMVPVAAYQPGMTITVSVYLRSLSASTDLFLWVWADTPSQAIGPPVPVTIVSAGGLWVRASVTVTLPTPLPVSSGGIGLRVGTVGTIARSWYADGLQVEQDVAPTVWKLGGTPAPLAAGVVLTSKRKVASSFTSMLLHTVTGTDWRWLADKRLAAVAYAYQTCGAMFRNLIDTTLAAEGVTYGRGVNLLSAQQSDVESTDMTAFNAIGAVTLTQDTTGANVHHGAGALKCVTSGAATFQGVEVRVANSGPNFPYGGSIVISWWMKASAGTPTVRVFVQSSAGAIMSVVNVVLSTTYQKIVLCAEIPYPSSATFYAIRWDTGTPAQAITVYMDQMQMELGMATPWSPGGGVSTNLLSAEQADVESATTTGFATSGGGVVTIAQDTTVVPWSGSGTLKTVVNGAVAFQGVQMSVAGALPANGILTVSFYAMSNTAMQLYIPVNGVGQSNFLPLLTPQWVRYQLSIQLPASPPNPLVWQILTPVAQAGQWWIDGLQMEVAAEPTAWELGGTQQTIFDGPEVVSQVINYKQVATAFDELATLAGFYWTIDTSKVAWFRDPATNVAPWSLDGTQAVDGTLEIEDMSPQYRNSQWMLGALGTTNPQTETQKGDGAKRAFLTSYPIHSVPIDIHINAGAAQTVGILGIDTGKQWYWNKGSNALTQDATGTLLTTTDVLSCTYIGEFVIVSNSVDSAQTTLEQMLEGAGTGIVEQATADTSLVTLSQAFQSGAALLSKFATPGEIVTFLTNTPGLQPGQVLTVNLPAPWGMFGVQSLVEQVGLTYDDFQWWYQVRALVGPVSATWVQFYQSVTSKQSIIDTTVGSASSIVNLAVTETAAWNWTASYTATVTSFPVFPLTLSPATLC